MHCGTTTLVGSADAASGDQSSRGKCRLGCVIGLMPLTFSGPCHILQWTSKFSGELVKSILRGKLYARSGMVDYAAFLPEFFTPADLLPGMVGMENCESLFTHLRDV